MESQNFYLNPEQRLSIKKNQGSLSILSLVSVGLVSVTSVTLFAPQASSKPLNYRCIPATAAQKIPTPPDVIPTGMSVPATSTNDLRPLCPLGEVPQHIPKRISNDAVPSIPKFYPSHGQNSVSPSLSPTPPIPPNSDSPLPVVSSLKEKHQFNTVGRSSDNFEYRCVRETNAQKIPTPPDSFISSTDDSSSKQDPFLKPVCPLGQVPQPIAKFASSPYDALDPIAASALAKRNSRAR